MENRKAVSNNVRVRSAILVGQRFPSGIESQILLGAGIEREEIVEQLILGPGSIGDAQNRISKIVAGPE